MKVVKKTKKGEVRFEFLESDVLLKFFQKNAKSNNVGRVTTCAEEELKSDGPRAGGYGIFACDDLIGSISFEITPSKLNPGFFSAKLDLVTVVENVRGMGIGTLLMSSLYLRLGHYFGDRLIHLSTTAVHPSVGHFMTHLGLTTANPMDEGPLYTITFQNLIELKTFMELCEKEVYERITRLRLDCIRCMSFTRPLAPWCYKAPLN